MAAEPIAPEQQAEIDTVLLIASTVKNRGSFTQPFADAVATLNGICARIFKAPDPDADEEPKVGWA